VSSWVELVFPAMLIWILTGILTWIIAVGSERDRFHKEAVALGHAEFQMDQKKNITFKWKEKP
jgi:hypothetical protein